MQVDIVGRINNLQLPRTQPYIPLFECLVNSIEAMAHLPSSNLRRIDVHIEHDVRQQGLKGIEDAASSIQNITVNQSASAVSFASRADNEIEEFGEEFRINTGDNISKGAPR